MWFCRGLGSGKKASKPIGSVELCAASIWRTTPCMSAIELLNVETDYTWSNKAQEISRLLEFLKNDDLEYVLEQLQAIVRYIKSQRES